jgi:hypothetical protein
MGDATHNQKPEVVLANLGLYLNAGVLIATQLQRAWCLGFVRTIWPTISWDDALRVAKWINDGKTDA